MERVINTTTHEILDVVVGLLETGVLDEDDLVTPDLFRMLGGELSDEEIDDYVFDRAKWLVVRAQEEPANLDEDLPDDSEVEEASGEDDTEGETAADDQSRVADRTRESLIEWRDWALELIAEEEG